MNKIPESRILASAGNILVGKGILSSSEAVSVFCGKNCESLSPDGSTRRFWRVTLRPDGTALNLIIVAPAGTEKIELAEAEAGYHIGTHLYGKGVSVPKVYGRDQESGVLIFEDLGDKRLHDYVLSEGRTDDAARLERDELYRKTVRGLVHMQIAGGEGFDSSWCWDTPHYDLSLMIEKESNYFLNSFWRDVLQKNINDGARDEFLELARRASNSSPRFFLHRDFQCRNVMVLRDEPIFIDFQGGRLGPLGYDIASLLIDPYSGLSRDEQDFFLEIYVDELKKKARVDQVAFYEEYNYLALQRNLQILGAFSFLYRARGKKFFKQFIRPALMSLSNRLEERCLEDFSIVKSMATEGLQDLRW